MFSYYGSKSKIVDYYPYPKFDKIIEPFAGSARYSLKHFEKDVLLVDKYEVIVKIWKYLQQASINDIKNLPILKEKETLDKYNLSEGEKLFMGFIIKGGNATPGLKYSGSGNFGANQKEQYSFIADQLYKIRHWEIRLDDYKNIKNEKATWFIDPPYQFGGEYYKESNKSINYSELAKWSKSRNGQIIICENTKADWMPFKPMVKMQGSLYITTEAIWSNYETEYDWETINMFDN